MIKDRLQELNEIRTKEKCTVEDLKRIEISRNEYYGMVQGRDGMSFYQTRQLLETLGLSLHFFAYESVLDRFEHLFWEKEFSFDNFTSILNEDFDPEIKKVMLAAVNIYLHKESTDEIELITDYLLGVKIATTFTLRILEMTIPKISDDHLFTIFDDFSKTNRNVFFDIRAFRPTASTVILLTGIRALKNGDHNVVQKFLENAYQFTFTLVTDSSVILNLLKTLAEYLSSDLKNRNVNNAIQIKNALSFFEKSGVVSGVSIGILNSFIDELILSQTQIQQVVFQSFAVDNHIIHFKEYLSALTYLGGIENKTKQDYVVPNRLSYSTVKRIFKSGDFSLGQLESISISLSISLAEIQMMMEPHTMTALGSKTKFEDGLKSLKQAFYDEEFKDNLITQKYFLTEYYSFSMLYKTNLDFQNSQFRKDVELWITVKQAGLLRKGTLDNIFETFLSAFMLTFRTLSKDERRKLVSLLFPNPIDLNRKFEFYGRPYEYVSMLLPADKLTDGTGQSFDNRYYKNSLEKQLVDFVLINREKFNDDTYYKKFINNLQVLLFPFQRDSNEILNLIKTVR
ncbi:MAG: hypothetical protein LBM27_04935, partial [Lactobacillaceae bacterium]|nr:hypothetical protein [Lactobacillaceae bacterium]